MNFLTTFLGIFICKLIYHHFFAINIAIVNQKILMYTIDLILNKKTFNNFKLLI